jgi:hypothetical protein
VLTVPRAGGLRDLRRRAPWPAVLQILGRSPVAISAAGRWVLRGRGPSKSGSPAPFPRSSASPLYALGRGGLMRPARVAGYGLGEARPLTAGPGHGRAASLPPGVLVAARRPPRAPRRASPLRDPRVEPPVGA